MKSTPVVLESQPDYLRVSAHHTDLAAYLLAEVQEWQAEEIDDGARPRPFRLMGYTGLIAGRVAWGQREGMVLAQLSGDRARRHLHIARLYQEHVTRLDLAVTCRLDPSDDGIAADHYNAAMAHRLHNPTSARPQIVQDGDGGSTFYLGHRESEYLLRVYNKEAERRGDRDPIGTERYAGCWRYELEVKGQPTALIAKLVDEHPEPAEYIQAFVHSYTTEHGVIPVFPPVGSQALRPGLHRRSDRQKTLAWFRSSVGPSLRRILDTGDPAEVWDALGVIPPPPPAQSLTES